MCILFLFLFFFSSSSSSEHLDTCSSLQPASHPLCSRSRCFSSRALPREDLSERILSSVWIWTEKLCWTVSCDDGDEGSCIRDLSEIRSENAARKVDARSEDKLLADQTSCGANVARCQTKIRLIHFVIVKKYVYIYIILYFICSAQETLPRVQISKHNGVS